MFKFFKDSWDYLDRFSQTLFVISCICHLFLLISIAFSFTTWILSAALFRLDIFLSLFVSIPYIVYYNYIKRKESK